MAKINVADRMQPKTAIMPNGCWEWTGALDGSGYSMMWYEGRCRRAHVVMYELTKGKIPKGLQIDHTCHKPADCEGGDGCRHRRCINPDHLEAVTKQENGKRGHHRWQKFYACGHAFQRAKTHCPSGHEYTPDNTAIHTKKGYNYRRCKQCDRDSQNARNRRLKQCPDSKQKVS
jgi:hypothetical protein